MSEKAFSTSDTELARSPAARALAERALIWLLHELRAVNLPIIVAGGLVPEVLARDAELGAPVHLGTTDVDIVVAFHATLDVDLGELEAALKRANFSVDPKIQEGWRWRAKVGTAAIKIKFLCDLDDQPEHRAILLPGCERLAAANLHGTGFVARDYVTETLTGELEDGSVVTVDVNFAGLEGYLMSKLTAARERGQEKDYYDLTYVLLHNRAGGPAQAGELLAGGKFAPEVLARRTLFVEVAARFHSESDSGPRAYASQTLLADPTGGEAAILRQDAVATVAALIGPIDIALQNAKSSGG